MDNSDEFVPSWSQDKLELLAKYLRAYSLIMRRQKARWLRAYAYVDAFASVGRYVDPETGEYIDGSPLVALKCEPPFDRYWFIERLRSRLDRLQQRVSIVSIGKDVRLRHGDANEILVADVMPDVSYARYERGMVFLDPYGLQVRWTTVAQLAAARSFDIFMNLSTMGIARLLDRGRLPSGRNREVLDAIMGGTEWVDELYTTQIDLFGDVRTTRGRIPHERIAAAYIGRVNRLFPHVSEPVIMKNSRQASLYVLFLASYNQTAVQITNDIFMRYERLRSFGT